MCLSGQFKCTKNQKCIPINLRCNGQDDCGDEEDERDCRKLCLENFALRTVAGFKQRTEVKYVKYCKCPLCKIICKKVNSWDCLLCNASYTREQTKMSFINFIFFLKSLQRRGVCKQLFSSI